MFKSPPPPNNEFSDKKNEGISLPVMSRSQSEKKIISWFPVFVKQWYANDHEQIEP